MSWETRQGDALERLREIDAAQQDLFTETPQ